MPESPGCSNQEIFSQDNRSCDNQTRCVLLSPTFTKHMQFQSSVIPMVDMTRVENFLLRPVWPWCELPGVYSF